MQWRSTLSFLCIFSYAALLFLFPEVTKNSVQSGLSICFNLIIPSLFPFFVLSNLLISTNFAGRISPFLQKFMFPILRVNGSCITAILLGLIGGYPIGIATLSKLHENGQCTREDVIRCSGFCNYCGPAFLFGVTGIGIFSSAKIGLALILIHAFTGLIVGILFRFYPISAPMITYTSNELKEDTLLSALPNAIKDAFSATLHVCAFVIFFNALLELLISCNIITVLGNLIPFCADSTSQTLISGILELSSGIYRIDTIQNITIALAMASTLLAWGGFSVHLQSIPFLQNSGVTLIPYFIGKIIHATLAGLTTFLLSPYLIENAFTTTSAPLLRIGEEIPYSYPSIKFIFYILIGTLLLLPCIKSKFRL